MKDIQKIKKLKKEKKKEKKEKKEEGPNYRMDRFTFTDQGRITNY